MKNKKLIVLAGPTAVGKTELALRLAAHWSTAIVSADSRQIFREMEIGTAKPSRDQMKRIPHYFIDTHSVSGDYDAGRYSRDAIDKINELFQQHDNVILCGGSGLYIKAVCEGFDDIPEVPATIRKEIMADYEKKGLGWLQDNVKKNDPDYFRIVDRQNPQRLVRALELFIATGKSMSMLRTRTKRQHPFAIVKIGLIIGRDLLYQRIDHRVDSMILSGLVEEVRRLYPFRELNALQTVGYSEIIGYLDGLYDLEEAVRLIKRNTRNYAKRQLTWFRRDTDMTWFDPASYEEILQTCEDAGIGVQRVK